MKIKIWNQINHVVKELCLEWKMGSKLLKEPFKFEAVKGEEAAEIARNSPYYQKSNFEVDIANNFMQRINWVNMSLNA